MESAKTDDRRASAVLYDQIIGSRNSLRRSNVEALKQICDRMEKDGISISAAEVVRRCGPDGPAYSTVSNKGSSLGDYVRLRMNEQTARMQKGPDRGRSLADQLQDPILQARAKDIEGQARWVQRENGALRSLLKSLTPGVDIDRALSSGPSAKGGVDLQSGRTSVVPTDPELGDAILTLVKHLIGERGYEIYRQRLCINKKPVLTLSQLQSLQKAVGLNEVDWNSRFGAPNSPES